MKDNLKLLTNYLKTIKNVELTEADIKFFEDILGLERNRGYRHAMQILGMIKEENECKETKKY